MSGTDAKTFNIPVAREGSTLGKCAGLGLEKAKHMCVGQRSDSPRKEVTGHLGAVSFLFSLLPCFP